MRPFDLFVGVDWSGNADEHLDGLAVAVCGNGREVPNIVFNQAGRKWSRASFARWLLSEIAGGARILCGLDFSFGFPYTDSEPYFPGMKDQPDRSDLLWQLVDSVCADDPHWAATSFVKLRPYSDFFYRGGRRTKRLRFTEAKCDFLKLGNPETVFKLVGSKQVGKSSLTGMRFLNWLKQNSDQASVWPFDNPDNAPLVLVETFPTAFRMMADKSAKKVTDITRLQRVMQHFQSESWTEIPGYALKYPDAKRRKKGITQPYLSDDISDALIISAALRHLGGCGSLWNMDSLSDTVRRREGWIFGVTQ